MDTRSTDDPPGHVIASATRSIQTGPPRVLPDYLARTRLLHQLDAGLNSALTLVSAPAGFGKTSLLAHWVANVSLPAAWVSVGEYDSSTQAFFTSVAEAVRALFPSISMLEEAMRLLQYGARAPQHYIAATLLRELCEIPNEFVLVIDDYHLISDTASAELITDLVQKAPRTLHLILSSRADPSLSLDRMRARSQLTEIRASALQFTSEEVEAFLRPHLGDEISRKIAAEATERTEGWIAGLRLAILSLQTDPRPDEFLARLKAHGGQYVMGYLLSEVLAQQSLYIQTFLLRTSLLDLLSGDLCDVVAGARELGLRGHTALEQIPHLNLFLTRLDDQGGWYRYHALFQELLQRELLVRFGQAEVSRLHRRAGEWYAQQGMVDEALRHTLQAEDLEAAAGIVERQVDKALNEQRWRDLERWLKLLPESLVQERPALLVALATVHGVQQRLSAIPPLVRRAEELMQALPDMSEALPDTVLRGMCDALWAQEYYFKSESAEGLQVAARALTALPASSTYGRGTSATLAAMLQQQSGEGEAAAQTLERLIDTDESASVTARVLFALCLISRQAGRLDRCHTAAKRLLLHAQRHHLEIDNNWARYFLGWVAYERNQLDEARDHFLAVSEQRYFANAIAASDSISALALTYHARGRATEAEEALQDLHEYAVELNHSVALAAVVGLQARLALARDDVSAALVLLPSLDRPSSPPMPMVWMLPPSLTQARILLAQGDEDSVRQAVERLAALERFARSTHDVWRLHTIHSLQAMAHNRLGQPSEALALMRRALAAAQPGRFVRTFVDCGPTLVDLLREIRLQGLRPEMTRYIDDILRACEPARNNAASEMAILNGLHEAQSRLASPLTSREIEVLLLLDRRYSDKEIAQELIISTFTVHAHTRSIYQKLDVADRREAALRARAIGLL